MVMKSLAGSVWLLASALLILVIGVSISLLSTPEALAACRDLASVQRSADLAHNEEMGGHVAQHILGMQPPWGSSQYGKTLFLDAARYRDAWEYYARVTNPRYCSGGHVLEVFELGGHLEALSCREADENGKCTRWDRFSATHVALGFVRQRDGAWILNTAYPLSDHP
jgi:hypothetical protein